MRVVRYLVCILSGLFFWTASVAQNPFITDLFTADPSARVFEGKVYVYPSHDVPCQPGQGFIGFCMADYHVYSSDNLTDWKDHGVIIDQNHIDWVDPARYSMWAPDCAYSREVFFLFSIHIERGCAQDRCRDCK